MEERAIRIITTGGTFDKHYDAVKGELTFRESHLPRILNQSRVTLPMTEEQRQRIAENAIASVEDLVVIIHGTDTMVQTAKLLEASIPEGDRHVFVFTGAMIPYALEESDAVFNLGCAMTAVQLLSPGVYITMGGRVYAADGVRKNREKGIFEAI